MPPLTRLWFAVLTHRDDESGTRGRVTLSINVGSEQVLNQVLPTGLFNTKKAALFKLNVEDKGLEASALTDASVRLHTESDNAWKPERFFVWGDESIPPILDVGIFPLAIEMGFSVKLSTDPDEGVRSLPLRRVARGDREMRINRLLILLSTKKRTSNSLEIQIVSNDRLVALCEIRNTSQDDLNTTINGNFYTMPVILPFTRSSLTNESITLRIKGGMDDWEPGRFFLFGLDDATGRPESVVPLVHLQEWPLGTMSPDTTNGIASVTLPLSFG